MKSSGLKSLIAFSLCRSWRRHWRRRRDDTWSLRGWCRGRRHLCCSPGQFQTPLEGSDYGSEVLRLIRADWKGSVLEVHLRVDGGPSEGSLVAFEHLPFALDDFTKERRDLWGELRADRRHHDSFDALEF